MAQRSFRFAVFTSVCLVAAAYHQRYVERADDSVQEESSQGGARMTKGRPSGYRDDEEKYDHQQYSWRNEEPSKHRQVEGSHEHRQTEYDERESQDDGRNKEYILVHYDSPSKMGHHQTQYDQNERHPQANYGEEPYQYRQQGYQVLSKVFKQEPMEHSKTYAKKPYTLVSEKKVPYEVKIPVERPYPVYIPQPYPVYVEKTQYRDEVPAPQPFTLEKKVPYEVKVPAGKPYPVLIDKPFPVFLDKKTPFVFEKPFPYPVKVPSEKPYVMPDEKEVAYQEQRFVHMPVKVDDDKPVLYPVDKPQHFLRDDKMPYTVVKEAPFEGKSSQSRPLTKDERLEFPQVGEQGEVLGGQKEEEVASIAEMGEVSSQELSKDQAPGSGSQQGYAAVQGDFSNMKQEKRQKLPIDVKRSVGKSFTHSSMQTSGKKMSYSTAIDHY